jgi:hypothetical protein
MFSIHSKHWHIPCRRRAINGDVLRINEDKVRAGGFHGSGPVGEVEAIIVP